MISSFMVDIFDIFTSFHYPYDLSRVIGDCLYGLICFSPVVTKNQLILESLRKFDERIDFKATTFCPNRAATGSPTTPKWHRQTLVYLRMSRTFHESIRTIRHERSEHHANEKRIQLKFSLTSLSTELCLNCQ